MPRSPRPLLQAALRAAAAGAALGLAAFLLETVLILRGESAGLRIDLRGPLAMVFDAVRPALPALLGRIALAYLAGGAALGLAALALARVLGASGRYAALLFPLEWLALLAMLCWHRAVLRPALFDDLPLLRPALAVAVDRGEPWQAWAALGIWLGAHACAFGARVRAGRAALGMNRAAAGAAIAAAALAVIYLGAVPRTAPANHPILVLIGIDAFRPDRLAAFGSTRGVAPNVDRFVSDAVLFERAYTPIAQTEPAWRSLLTARWPTRTGVRYPLTPDARIEPWPTFAGALTSAGFKTVFETDCSRWHFEGPASGFSVRAEPPRDAVNFLLEKLRYRGVGVFADNRLGEMLLPEMVDNRALAGIHDPAGYAHRLAASWVDAARAGPVLLAFHAVAAHFPGDPTYPFYRKFVPASEPLDRRLRMVFSPLAKGAQGSWTREGSEALYDELLAQADMQVGTILDALRGAGLYDRAAIVLFSDHGESFYADHPELAGATSVHGARLSEEENRILLAIKPPGPPAPRRVSSLVRLVDIGPTFLELAGLPPLEGADGVSLAPALRGEPVRPLRLYAETGFTHASPDVFDPGHKAGAPRTFEAYSVRPDGVVEMAEASREATIAEKDVGAFDGQSWLVRSPRADGSTAERCSGSCAGLAAWLDRGAPPE